MISCGSSGNSKIPVESEVEEGSLSSKLKFEFISKKTLELEM